MSLNCVFVSSQISSSFCSFSQGMCVWVVCRLTCLERPWSLRSRGRELRLWRPACGLRYGLAAVQAGADGATSKLASHLHRKEWVSAWWWVVAIKSKWWRGGWHTLCLEARNCWMVRSHDFLLVQGFKFSTALFMGSLPEHGELYWSSCRSL